MMSTKLDKLDFLQKRSSGAAEVLRERLDALEDEIVTIQNKPRETVRQFLNQMDSAQDLFEQLGQAGGPDLTPEHLRFETIRRRLMGKAGAILAALGGGQALRAARPAGAEMESRPWWFLDSYLAHQRAQFIDRMLKTVAVLAVVFLVITVLFNTVWKPDPAVVARTRHFDDALQALTMRQDYTVALAQVEQALAIAPQDLESLVLRGVILNQLGREDEAQAMFEQAHQLSSRPEQVPLLRGRLLLQLQQPEQVLDLANEVIAINPDSSEGWFLLGQAYERLNRIPDAYEAMATASELALAQDNTALYAVIRVNMGYLAPSIDLEPNSTPFAPR